MQGVVGQVRIPLVTTTTPWQNPNQTLFILKASLKLLLLGKDKIVVHSDVVKRSFVVKVNKNYV